jgi:hypothetical protein
LEVWGFPIATGVCLLLAAFGGGLLGLCLLPVCVWTFVLYVRCTRQAIKHRRHHEKKD